MHGSRLALLALLRRRLVVIVARARAAEAYSSRPTASSVRGGAEAEQINHAVIEVLRARGGDVTGDGRLADVASFVGANMDATGRPPQSTTVDGFSRLVGLIEPSPLLMMFSTKGQGSWVDTIGEMMRGAPKNIVYNRSGVVSLTRDGVPMTVVALSSSSVDIEPVPRHVSEGSKVALRGRVRQGYQHVQIDVTQPNGAVKHLVSVPGRSFDVAIPVASPGPHRVEILAEGPSGLEVLANFPVLAGMPDPPLDLSPISAPANAPTDNAVIAHQLLGMLNESRKQAGVPPLEPHAGLSQVAEAHSRDMVENGYFGHLSPAHGDPAARIRQRGLTFASSPRTSGAAGAPKR